MLVRFSIAMLVRFSICDARAILYCDALSKQINTFPFHFLSSSSLLGDCYVNFDNYTLLLFMWLWHFWTKAYIIRVYVKSAEGRRRFFSFPNKRVKIVRDEVRNFEEPSLNSPGCRVINTN